jgi:hypothetical protein
VDRAIDLLAVGTDPDGRGEPEQRAIAAGLIARRIMQFADDTEGLDFSCDLGDAIELSIDGIEAETVDPFGGDAASLDPASANIVRRELQIAHSAEAQTEALVRRLISGCSNHDVFSPGLGLDPDERGDSLVRLLIRRTFMSIAGAGGIGLDHTINIPPPLARSAGAQSWGDQYYEQR